MSPPDDKHYPLATKHARPRVGRSISARDYSLPKPYRRKRFVEDGPEMSRPRLAMLTFSGVLIAGLVVALALLAKENFDSPPVVVVAAPKEPALVPAAKTVAAVAPGLGKPFPKKAVHGRDDSRVPAPMLPIRKVAKIPQALPPPEATAPDADVVLITAILTLTPRADPATPAACTPGMVIDHGCAAIHGMDP